MPKPRPDPVLDEKYELNVAVRILNGPRLDMAIVERLVGTPQRYAELRSALKPKADMQLNRSLRRLLDWGVIDRLSDHTKKPAVRTYRLTPLGIHVFYTLATIRGTVRDYVEIARAIQRTGGVGTSA